MTLPDGKYCRWTCTGRVASVKVGTSGHPWSHRILTLETDPGEIKFFVRNLTLFETVDAMERGQVVTLSGIVTPDNQAQHGNAPYFLNPSAIEVY